MKVLSPQSLDEACALLARDPAPRPIAGATDILVHWPDNLKAKAETYLDISALSGLRHITLEDDTLTLGALTTYWDVIQCQTCRDDFPMLIDAARQVGSVQIQSRGTWAGNIVNASPAADGVPVLMAYDATVVLRSKSGEQEVRLDEFYSGYKQMQRRPDQLITAIRIPRRSYDTQIFEKVGPRRAQAISKVGLAITHSAEGWRVVAAAVAPMILRCKSVEALLESGVPVRSPDDLAHAIDQDVAPIDDIRSTREYRERVLARLIYHGLKGVLPAFS